MFQFIHLFLIVGLISFCLLAIYTFKCLGRGRPFIALFKDFNRKMWMTIYLGCAFFGFYLLIVSLSVYFIRPVGTEFLFLVYQNPIKFVYWGLSLFACLSLSIYLVRVMIKYFYLTRGKDR